MKAKKILTNILCISLVVSNILPAMATYTEESFTYSEKTNDSQETEVFYNNGIGDYFVRIPKLITLGKERTCSYSVEVNGDISSDKSVYVSPIDSLKDTDDFDFYMVDQSSVNQKQNVVATVNQDKFYWNFEEARNGYIEENNSVSALSLSAGTWKGTFDFEINMHSVTGSGETPEPDEEDFTLTTDGDVELEAGGTYQLNAYIDGVESNDQVEWFCDNENVIIENGLITLPEDLSDGEEITFTVSKNKKSVSFVLRAKEIDPYEVAPESASGNWNYTLDEENNIITLNYYIGSETDVVVYANYPVNGKIYKTQLASNSINANVNTKYMFNGNAQKKCQTIKTIIFSKNIDTSNMTNISHMFSTCSYLTNLDLSSFDTSNVTNMEYMFNMCSSLTSLDISDFDTSNVTDMSYMFKGCCYLISLNLTNFDTSSVTNMNNMFQGCSKLVYFDISNFDTSRVTNMYMMFSACNSLTDLDLSNFDTSNVTNMKYMFDGCKALSNLNTDNWDTSNVTDMGLMFYYCQALTTLNLSHWNTNNVTDMQQMFSNCSSLTSLDLSNWDTSKVKLMFNMFYYCKNLKTIYVTEGKWSVSHLTATQSSDMFTNCGTSSVTYK